VIEEILFSSEGSPIKSPETFAVPQDSPVLESKQASTETNPKQTPTSRPVFKRKAEAQPSPSSKPAEEPSSKRAKTIVAPSLKLEKFLKRGVVRDKIVKAEFYANVTVSEGLLTSTVNGVLIEVDARALRVILGVPATGFDLYVREDKSLLGKARLLELAQHLSQQPGLKHPQTVKKGDIQPLHQLIF